MEIKYNAVAGTSESSDVLISIDKGNGKIDVELESIVINQYGDSIKQEVLDVLKKFDVTDCKINILDRGALPQVIRARVETAIKRSQKGGNK